MKFADVLEIKNGRNQRQVENLDGRYPIYGSGGVMGRADDYICEAETVVIGRKGSINNPIFVNEPFWNVDTAFGLIAKREVLLPKYLYYFCVNFDFEKLNTTVTIPSLTKANLLQIEIALPKLEEQKKVVDVLDKVTNLVELRQQQLAKLDELVKARFVEMFGGINESVWYPYQTIESFTSVMSGGTPDRNIPEYWQGNIRWIKTTELKNCIITDTEEKISQLGVENSSAKIIPANSILVAMYGQGKTRGMTGYITVECATNQACACILPSEKINQKYLWKYIIFSYDKLRSMAKGGNQPNLNAGIIRKFPVLMPPMNLQNRFAVFAEQVEKTKLFIQNSLKQMETLKKALMQQYFG